MIGDLILNQKHYSLYLHNMFLIIMMMHSWINTMMLNKLSVDTCLVGDHARCTGQTIIVVSLYIYLKFTMHL